MRRLMLAAIAAASLLLIGQGAPRAAGEPDSKPRQNAGAAPGQQFGTQADVAAKKRLDAPKYQKPTAESTAGAGGESSSKQQR